MTPLLVVGAHLDDAVLSCGRLLAAAPGAVVVTVFAGRPERYPATVWDAACGFGPGDDVVAVRSAEDDAALAALGARGVRLAFPDAQYAGRVDVAAQVREVAAALAGVVAREAPRRVLGPLGLLHRDHRVVAAAMLRVRAGSRAAHGVYEDVPYRSFRPVRHRLAALARVGVRLGPPTTTTDADAGPRAAAHARQAVAAYASQAAGLAALAARAAGPPTGGPADVVHPVLPGRPGRPDAAVTAAASPRPSRARAARPA